MQNSRDPLLTVAAPADQSEVTVDEIPGALRFIGGRVSKSGVFPLAPTLDHVGPLTRTVEDNALMLNAMAGHDPQDLHSAARPPEDFARDLENGVRDTVVGVPTGFYFEHVEAEVEARVREAIEAFRDLGAEVREVNIPNVWETLSAQRLTLAAEAYAVHEERLKTEPDAAFARTLPIVMVLPWPSSLTQTAMLLSSSLRALPHSCCSRHRRPSVSSKASSRVIKRSCTARQTRAAYNSRASSDFFGAVGWVVGLVLTLAVWFGFVEVLGVNIGAGLLEGAILRLLGQEVP